MIFYVYSRKTVEMKDIKKYFSACWSYAKVEVVDEQEQEEEILTRKSFRHKNEQASVTYKNFD